MKFISIALASVWTLSLSLSLPLTAKADSNESTQPCQASLDTSEGVDSEANNCPITLGAFSIAGTFANSNWRVSFWAWEPAYYILYLENKQDGTKINLTGFDVTGTTSRPQYRFTESEKDNTYVVTFRYSDPDTIRLEIQQKNREIVNELLSRESYERIGGP